MFEESDQVWSASEAAAPSLSLVSLWRQFEVQVQEQAQARAAIWPLHDIRGLHFWKCRIDRTILCCVLVSQFAFSHGIAYCLGRCKNENLRRRQRTNPCLWFSLQEDHSGAQPLTSGVPNMCAKPCAWLPNIGVSGGKYPSVGLRP